MSAIDNLLINNTHNKLPFDQPAHHPMMLPNPSTSKYSVSPPSPSSDSSNQSSYLQQSQSHTQSSYKQATPLKVSLPPIAELLKESSVSTPKPHTASIMSLTPSAQSTASSTTASSITAPTTSTNTPSPSTPASHIHTPQQLPHQLPQQSQPQQQQVLQPLITQQLLHQQFGPQESYQPIYSHQSIQYQQPGRVSPTVLSSAYPHQHPAVPQGTQVSSFYNPNTGRYEQTIIPTGSATHPAHSVSVHSVHPVHTHPGAQVHPHPVHQAQHPSAAGPILLDEKVANQQMRKKRQNLPRQTTLILLSWLSDHLDRPYPNSREKYELLLKTRLTIQQLDNWFINARRRKINVLKKLKENDQSISLTF